MTVLQDLLRSAIHEAGLSNLAADTAADAAVKALTAAAAHPVTDDAAVMAARWLDLHEDDECSIHPIHRSTVAGLLDLFECATARAAAIDTLPPTIRRNATEVAREERDEALGRCRSVAVLLREMANRSSVPPAGRRRQLADRLSGDPS